MATAFDGDESPGQVLDSGFPINPTQSVGKEEPNRGAGHSGVITAGTG